MNWIRQFPPLKVMSCIFFLSLMVQGMMATIELLALPSKAEQNKIQPTASERTDWLTVKKFNATPAKITASLHHLIQFYQLHCQTLEISLKRRDEGIAFYEVSLTLSALSDRGLKKFICHLQEQIKPLVTLQTLRLLRIGKITPSMLQAIGKGKPQKIIEAHIILQWVSHEKSID